MRVANTIAPHYTVTNHSDNLGPTDSGLLGPVTLRRNASARVARLGHLEIERLTNNSTVDSRVADRST